MAKVIASDVRKGNVLELDDGKLYVVLAHETFRPGKGHADLHPDHAPHC